jgi:hypothetical protein
MKRTISVPGPADRVYEYIEDFSNASEWDPGLVVSERLDAGEIGVGSRFRIVARFWGRDLETVYELTDRDPPLRVTFVGGTDRFTSTDVISVTDRGDEVTVDYRAIFELSGILRIIEPFLKGTFESLADDAVAGLERVLSS